MINGVLKPPQIKLSGWETGVNYWGSANTKGIFFLFAGISKVPIYMTWSQ